MNYIYLLNGFNEKEIIAQLEYFLIDYPRKCRLIKRQQRSLNFVEDLFYLIEAKNFYETVNIIIFTINRMINNINLILIERVTYTEYDTEHESYPDSEETEKCIV